MTKHTCTVDGVTYTAKPATHGCKGCAAVNCASALCWKLAHGYTDGKYVVWVQPSAKKVPAKKKDKAVKLNPAFCRVAGVLYAATEYSHEGHCCRVCAGRLHDYALCQTLGPCADIARPDRRGVVWKRVSDIPKAPKSAKPTTPGKQTKAVTFNPATCGVDGITYTAARSAIRCKDCAGQRDTDICARLAPCHRITRPDGRTIVWKRIKYKADKPVKVEPCPRILFDIEIENEADVAVISKIKRIELRIVV
jgi:hypothetical protein